MTDQTIQAFPLTWPDNLPRTERKANSQFKTGLSSALKNVRSSLELFGRDSNKPITDLIISSNVTLGNERPTDSGVAVWFTWDGAQRCIAVDRYPKTEDNLQAIHHVLEARRTEMRHGGLHIVRQTFKGFTALPAPKAAREWRKVLGISGPVDKEAIDAAYRAKAKAAHPDSGGSTEQMTELNTAKRAALAAIGA